MVGEASIYWRPASLSLSWDSSPTTTSIRLASRSTGGDPLFSLSRACGLRVYPGRCVLPSFSRDIGYFRIAFCDICAIRSKRWPAALSLLWSWCSFFFLRPLCFLRTRDTHVCIYLYACVAIFNLIDRGRSLLSFDACATCVMLRNYMWCWWLSMIRYRLSDTFFMLRVMI